MAFQSGDYDMELENNILEVVDKIKGRRSRASIQSIHAMLEKAGISLSQDDLRVFVKDLVKQGTLTNLAKDIDDPNKESFAVCKKVSADGGDEYSGEDIFAQEDSQDLSCLHNIIDQNFDIVLQDKIARAVESVMDEKDKECSKMHHANPEVIKDIKECDFRHNMNYELIDSLNKHIEFLQKELESKDFIIKMILNDRTNSYNRNINYYGFLSIEYPKIE